MFHLFQKKRKTNVAIIFQQWQKTCIKPFYSFLKSDATKQLEKIIKEHDQSTDLLALQSIQQGITAWLQERQSVSLRTKLVIEFQKKINQMIVALEAQKIMPPCMSMQTHIKPFARHLFYTLENDTKNTFHSLLSTCHVQYESLAVLWPTISSTDTIQTNTLINRSLFFENCYVIYHNIEKIKTHHGSLLTCAEQNQIVIMQKQLVSFMQTIDQMQRSAFDSLPHSSEQFRCDFAYKVRHKLFSCICLPCIDYFVEIDSVLNITLDIMGIC